ncbi:glycosyltransferase [Undibacterium sp. SXout7W]|uniref:glycosyltransferase n=1 Tax=Undibacterium sp. SXout7W TaxID=3413049 RepID=UPI003BF3DBF4
MSSISTPLFNQTSEQWSLLIDVIDRTCSNPSGSHCWLELSQRLSAISDESVLQKILQSLVKSIPDQGISGFYLATLLDLFTHDRIFLKRARALLKTMTPFDADRMSAFFNVAVQRALMCSGRRQNFKDFLEDVGLVELSQDIARHLEKQIVINIEPRPVSHIKKIAIVAPQLRSMIHPPTQMALHQAELLSRNGVETRLFSCQEGVGPGFDHLYGTGASEKTFQVDLQPWLTSVGAGVTVHLGDQRFSLMRRWLDILKEITLFAPDLILFVGLHSGLLSSLYKKYPILGLGTNSVPPMVPTDVWLSSDKKLSGLDSSTWGDVFPASLAWYHPYRIQRKTMSARLTRSELGIDDHKLVLISLGSHLDSAIQGLWAKKMCQLINEHADVVWLMIGGAGRFPVALQGIQESRLQLMPYTIQVQAFMMASDIYVNPPIMGGGFSVAEAMQIGLPVVSFADSDGGDKVGDMAVTDMDSYFGLLRKLISDRPLRAEMGTQLQRQFTQQLDLDHSDASLLRACAITAQRYNQRIISVSS